MSDTNAEKARAYMHKLLAAMSEAGGSDLFIANDFPPSMKAHGNIKPLSGQKLTGQVTRELAYSIMTDRQREEFEREFECNFAITLPDRSRFRVNVFVQQQYVGMPADIRSFIRSYLPATESKTPRTRRDFSSGVTRS